MLSRQGLLFKTTTKQLMAAKSMTNRFTMNQAMLSAQRSSFSTKDNFLNGTNANYADHMYSQWKADPSSVHASWHAYFTNMEGGADASTSFETAPTLGQSGKDAALEEILSIIKQGGVSAGSDPVASARASSDAAKLAVLVRAHLTHGHLLADIDPLRLKDHYKGNDEFARKFRFPQQKDYDLLDYRQYGFTEADLEKTYYLDMPQTGSILKKKKEWKLKDLIGAYQSAYCQKIGVEFMHINDREICNWIREKFENLQYE